MAAPLSSDDLKRIAAEVSVQHGIRIDPDDPMMAVVTINRIAFEQAVADVIQRVESAVRDFETAAERVQVRAGGVLAQEVRECGTALKEEFNVVLNSFRRDASERRPLYLKGFSLAELRWLIAGLALGMALLSCGIWIGTAIR